MPAPRPPIISTAWCGITFCARDQRVADIQIKFVSKDERDGQSHAIARRIREKITPLAQRLGARIKVAEVPPGPPVLQTIVAEIYGPDYGEQIRIAEKIQSLFEESPGVVDVDSLSRRTSRG